MLTKKIITTTTKEYDGGELPFYSKVYCKEFYAKPCRFEYECEWCGLTE